MRDALFDCIDADEDGEEIATAITAFADECQYTLDLVSWPAESICSDFESDFNLFPYMDEFCNPECIYGTRASGSSPCVCNVGYWNSSCSLICPGGAEEPCSGYGTCDQDTGKCDCPVNRKIADDCSVCSDGWYGTDCNIAINEEDGSVTNLTAIVGQLGLIYSLDGISYVIKTQGEMLLLAISDNIIIQGKFITCYQNYSCMSFLGARIGDSSNGYSHITVQSQRISDSKPVVYINEELNSLDNTVYFNGFKLYRSGFFELVIEITDLLILQVRVQGQYLQLSMDVPSSLIESTSGWLSGALLENTTDKLNYLYNVIVPVFEVCNDTTSTQTILGVESSTVLNIDPFEQTYGNESSFDPSKFTINECDSVIFYPLDEYKLQSQGGFGLSFSKSSINHEFYANQSTELTFEMLVKPSETNESGVLFSFTSNVSLIVVNGESYVEIHTLVNNNESVYDTGLALDDNYWNKIVMTYDNEDGSVVVYAIDKDSAISTTGSFTIETGLFNKNGTLTIGHWHIPTDCNQFNLPNGFTGSIENFMIWNTIILESEVSQLWEMDPAIASGSLLLGLQFDEGDGDVTTDSTAYAEIDLPQYPWKAPEWFISDLQYSTVNNLDFTFTYFLDDAWMIEAKSLCFDKIFSLDCPDLNNGTKEMYYLLCQQVLSVVIDKTAGYNTILDMMHICEKQHNMPQSEVTTFCSSISTDDKNGTSCSTNCKFGYEFSNGSCSCFTGYYGSTCDSVCPGTSDSPCSGHGECQTDGSCKCWWNWNGNGDCSTCTTDSSGSMIGPDCTILETSSLSSASLKVSAVSSNGYYMTFDGQQISFIDEAGAFLLFYSSDLDVTVHAYQVSCHYGSCLAAISVASPSDNVVITPAGQGYTPLIYVNGEFTIMDDITNTYSSSLRIEKSSLTEINVQITTIGSITVYVMAQEQFLQASVVTATTVCQSANGVFGSCNGNGMDYSSMTQSEITEYVVTNFRLTSSIILDVLDVPVGDGSSITGYALSFNNTASMSPPLSYPAGFSFTNQDFSLSLYFKPSAYGGYILSYSKSTTFALLNDDPVQLQCSTSSIPISFTAELNVWNQLILTFRRSTQQVEVYHFGNNSKVSHEIINFDCPGIFDEGGIVMLGEYLPSVDSDAYTFNSSIFVGLIDELSIWKTPIPDWLIYQAHLLNIKASDFNSEMSTLFSFTEGVGAVAFEQINGNNLAMPASPWQAPSWIVSDLGLQTLREHTNEVYTTIDIDPSVESNCSEFFDSSAVSSGCSSVTDSIKWWYKQMCMITATNTGNISDITMAMVDFTSVCKVTGNTVTDIYTKICSLNIEFPGWLAQICSNCAFGYDSNGECVCYYGYYGTYCDAVCPGGVVSPCNDHGECDVEGNCQCYGHWEGTECDTCATNWSGDECTIYTTGTFDPLGDNAETLVAQVNLIGQLSTFDGTIVDVPLRGYYNLLSVDSLDVELHGRFSVCSSDTALHVCLVGFVIVHNGEKYYISHEAYDTSSVEILSDSTTLNLYDTLTLGNLNLKLESPTTVKMTVSDSDLIVKMSAINDRLLATVSLPRTEWDSLQSDIEGVVTACDSAVAITASNCSISRDSICSDPTQDIPDHCEMPQTKDALKLFLQNAEYTDEAFISTIEEIYLSAMESNCLQYEGTGISSTGLTLPESDFTIELHVKPTAEGGIIMTYDHEGEYMTLINHANGLIVAVENAYYTTDLILTQDVWNQISLAWRDDADILEVYLTDDSGMLLYITCILILVKFYF